MPFLFSRIFLCATALLSNSCVIAEDNDFLFILQNSIFYLNTVDVSVTLITDVFRLEIALSTFLLQPHAQNRVTVNPDQLAQGFISQIL